METQRLGGHEGMVVERVTDPDTQLTAIEKKLTSPSINRAGNLDALANELNLLIHLHQCGFTPAVLGYRADGILEEDLGPCQPVTDPEAFRRNCVKMLATFRKYGVRHGDLTGPQEGGESNIIVRDNWPYAVDWQEGHLLSEPAPQKSPYTDSWLLMRTLEQWPTASGETIDTPRVARRWKAVLEALGAHLHDDANPLPLKDKTFIDLGTYMGDFVALAAAEGMDALGIDRGGFRTGEDSIEIGWSIWSGFPFGRINLAHGNIVNAEFVPHDVGMMFSTYPYLAREFGRKTADTTLAVCIASCDVFFFETQLYGDGPGMEYHQTVKAVRDWLCELAPKRQVYELVTIPVAGRDAARTVFEVR